MIRVFTDPDVAHVAGKVSPEGDIDTIHTELVLADLQTLDRALPRLEKESRLVKDKQPLLVAAREAQQVLDSGRTLSGAGVDRAPLRELSLLTTKPFLYVFNMDQAELVDEALKDRLRALVAPAEAIFLDAQLEAELVELPPGEALELLRSTGQAESGLDMLARAGFETLGLQTFLTTGPKEARAWTIRRGATAPEAAGAIHTDFPARLHQGGGGLVRRHGGRADHGRGEGAWQAAHRGQGLRHVRWRRRGVPLQRVGVASPSRATARYAIR